MRADRDHGLFVCDHCGSQREAPSVIEQVEFLTATSSVCPSCSAALSKARLEGHQILCCSRCFGMLIEMNRFVTVIGLARARERRPPGAARPRSQNPGDRHISCPECGQQMNSHLYGGPGNVVIDSCGRCLVNWLDASELGRIASAPDST
jgi:Zn-finger nucleic acid-binding protein